MARSHRLASFLRVSSDVADEIVRGMETFFP
jgi:hypothetical protein